MSLHRGGPPGAVAVSYTTNTMAPLSPSRRYSSSSSSSASTPGITANGSKFSSYRSPSTALERSTYGSTSSTTTGSSASSYRLSARKTHCSPARSVSSYSDSGTVATVNLPPKYTSGSSTTSSLSSSASTNSRDRNGFVNPNLTEFYAKYSPNNYTPNIHGNGLANSSSSSTINGHCRSSFSLSSSSSIGGIAELHGGDDSGFRERRDRSYSSDTTSSVNFGSERWSTRQTKRRNYPLNTVFAGHDQIDGVAAPNEVIIHHHPDQICKNSNPIDDSDDNGNSNSADNDKLVNNDQDSDNINNINHQNHLTLTNNQSRHLITPISTPSDPDHSSPESPASQPCNPISTASLTSIYTSSAGATDHRACEFNKTPTNPANTELPINDSDQEFSGHLEKNRQRELDRLALLNIPHGHVNNQEICGGSATTFSNSTADVDGAQSISESIKTPLTSLTNLNGLALHDECKISNMGSDLLEENKLSNRPTGFDEPSKPSTSSRRFECFQWDHSVEDFDASSANNTSSVPVAVHQAIYTGLNDQIEESSTSRPSRNRNQARRDDSHGLNGLRNIGNTCFMNSVIQCLSNTRPLLEYLLNEQYLNDINTTTSSMKGALIKAFAQVIHELWESSGDHAVNTASLKTQIQRFAPRFIGYAQQDAQEFLRYLLEGLHEDVNRVIVKPQPISTDIPDNYSDMNKAAESWKRYLRSEDSTIVDVFVGQLRSSLTCTSCDHVSVTLDPFWDLSLPIPSRSGTVRLNQCLEHFTKVETMDGDEKPTCSKCQMRRKCTKSFSIQKFPKILVIHLKRFSPTERFRAKLSVLVDFPLTGLDLSAFAAPGVQGCTYNLYGVANHSGTPYSGHYTAYCKHPYSGEWHEYNDSRVSAVSASSVISSEAYVLFYEQQPLSHHL